MFGPSAAGSRTVLNITAPAVIKASAGTLVRILVSEDGTSGALTLNDCASLESASADNQVASFALDMPAIDVNWPFLTGIVISALPSGATVSVSYA